MRTAKIRLDRVQPGQKFVGNRSTRPAPYDDPEVLTSSVHPENERLWRITWSGGYFTALPEHQVRVMDESGLIQLQEDLEVYGPYVCTSGEPDQPETAGTIHFANLRLSGAPVIADLIIRRDDKTILTLKHVELGHIASMAAGLAERARQDPETPRYCARRKDGCGEYHVPGVPCPLPDHRP